MTDPFRRANLDLDIEGTRNIAIILRDRLDGVREEQMILHGIGAVSIAVVVDLSGGLEIRCSINGGKILVTVGDGNTQIQREEWRRSEVGIAKAVGWILGYRAGYEQ
jgi:hypothetical protein